MSGKKNLVGRSLERVWHEWIKTQLLLTDAVEKKDFTSLTHLGNIPGFAGNNDLLKPEGLQHLTTAARELLHWEGMERQVSLRTMRSLLGKAFSDEVTAIRHKKKTVFNPDLVSGPAVRELKALKRDNGAYVIPAIFAPSAKQTNILIGPVCIISKQLFLDKQHDALVLGKDKHEPPWPDFVGEWEKYIKRFDHFVVVKVDNCEKEMAWKAAREAAEFALNLIRVSYGYFYTKNIKLAGGFLQDDRSAQLWFDENGNALFSTAHGPWGSHFDDNWFQLVNERQGGFKQIWSSFAQVLASGKSLVRPVFERQQYAHQLISEAYCEPHDHIRLVRLTAALEAFAMPEKNAIKESLAHRCALAGGWSNTVLAHEIYSTIKNAYDIRSAIVHGRGATHEEISTAFFQLEKYLIDIIQGFSILYAGIENASAPKSVDKLQKELTRRIDAFFWSPDIALSDSMGFQLSSNL